MAKQDIITVQLQTITDVKYAVKVRRTDKVEKLKTELWKTTGTKNKIKLMLSKEELDDGRDIQDYIIDDGSVIQMLLAPPEAIKITVHVFKKGTVELDVTDKHMAGDLRTKLLSKEHHLGSTPKIYDFYYDTALLEYDKPLHIYGISDNCNILLQRPDAAFKVRVVDAHSFSLKQFLEVRGTETILPVKERVIEIMNNTKNGEDEENFHPSNVVLFHASANDREAFTELDCETNTLNDYDVKPYDRIVCVKYIKTCLPNGCDIDYDGTSRRIFRTSADESVLSFRLKIQDQLGIPFANQILTIPERDDPRPGDKIGTLDGLRLAKKSPAS